MKSKEPAKMQAMKPVKSRINFLQLRVPIWVFLVLAGVISITLLSFKLSPRKSTSNPLASVIALPKDDCDAFHAQRLKDYPLISPLLFVDKSNESEIFNDLKSSVATMIGQEKLNGKINSASVYMKTMRNGEWFTIDPNESFYTASLMKVAVMITILKMSESIPGYLDKPYPFRYADPRIPKQTFDEKTIIPGHDYKMRELVYYMIVYSDNYASNILNNLMDQNIYTKLFSDIGIEGYDPTDQFRKLTPSDIGKLFRLLYNSSYLSTENSEYALSLLTKATFKGGLVKELPGDVVVAHKFAEAGGNDENELHDAGIVYAGKTPYLLIVMTRGKTLPDLSQSIGDISKKVYEYMNQKSVN